MRGKTILLIDDDKDLCEMTKKVLEVYGGYKVVTAPDGKEGIKAAHMAKPDLILLDINMPQMNGMEVLKLLKESAETIKIPVVMLTAYNEDILKVEASQHYNEDYIVKPVKTEDLVDRIEKVLKKRGVK